MKSLVVDHNVVSGLSDASSSEVARFTLAVLHLLTYLPLLVLPALQDAHLKLAVVLNTSLCLCLALANLGFHSLGIVKVFPKSLDTFLLVLYGAMIPVAYTQGPWFHDWINVLHSGAVACFVWLTILLPWWDSFATEALKDRLPREMWGLPAVKAAGLLASQGWGLATLLCTVATLPPVLLYERRKWLALHIMCDYVLVLLLLLGAAAAQWRAMSRVVAMCGAHDAGDMEVGVSVRLGPPPPLPPAPAQQLGSGTHSVSDTHTSRSSVSCGATQNKDVCSSPGGWAHVQLAAAATPTTRG